MSRITAAAMSLETDLLGRSFNRNLLRQGGMRQGYFTHPETKDEDDLDEFEEECQEKYAGEMRAAGRLRFAAGPATLAAVMKYLIDGYNVAYRMFGPGGRRASSEELRDLVLRRLRRFVSRRRRVTVVFDGVAGRMGTDRVGDVEVVYAGDADEEIVRRIRSARSPDAWSVVSADRELTGRVRQLGARVVRVIDFLDDLDDAVGPDAEPGEPPQKYDL